MDKIAPGATNQSILFHLDSAGLAITGMKLGYIRWTEGDGTSFTEVVSVALTELAAITTAHTDNFAKYLDADITGGNQFVIRVDVPDAAFATGKDQVICNVFDDGNNVISQRIFSLVADLSGYVDGYVYVVDSAGNTNTVLGIDGTAKNPVSTLAAAKTLADQIGGLLDVTGQFTSQAIDLGNYKIRGGTDTPTILGDTVTGVTLLGGTIEGINLGGDCILGSAFKARNCEITSLGNTVVNAGMRGQFENCRFDGDSEYIDRCYLKDCFGSMDIAGDDPATFKSNSNAPFHVAGWEGRINFENQTGGSALIEVFAEEGANVSFPVSNTGGTITWKGFTPVLLTATSTLNDLNTPDFVARIHEKYKDGRVYFGGPNAAAGTVLGVNGTYDKPCSVVSDLRVLGDLLGQRVGIFGTANISGNLNNYNIKGMDGAASIFGEAETAASFLGTFFEDIEVEGDQFPCDINTKFLRCLINDLAFGTVMGTATKCILKGKTIITGALKLVDCSSFDNTAQIEFFGAAARLTINNYQGPLLITDMDDAANTLEVYSDGDADITMDASNTNATATALFVGIGNKDTDSAATDITDSEWAELPLSGIGLTAAQVWDHLLTAISTPNSIGLLLEDKITNLPHSIKKNTAIPKFKFIMLDAITRDPKAGFDVTAARKLDADVSYTVMSGAIIDDASGAYSIDVQAVDNDGLTGVWRFTAPGAKTTFMTFITEAV